MLVCMGSCCFALAGNEAMFHPTLLLSGRADTDSSGSSRQSTPRILGVAIFIRRNASGGVRCWQVPYNRSLTCAHGVLASAVIKFHYITGQYSGRPGCVDLHRRLVVESVHGARLCLR